MPMTTWPISSRSIRVAASAPRIASPPSWVVDRRENRPGALLSTRMAARGRRRAPSRMTIGLSLSMEASLVKERGRHARAVLHEVLHPDVHVDGRAAAAEAVGLDRQPLGERPGQAAQEDVAQD